MTKLNDLWKRFAAAARGRRWMPRGRHIAACLSLLAFGSLTYLAGAGTMYFGSPASDFFTKAFVGFQDRRGAARPPAEVTSAAFPAAVVTEDQPGEAYNGFNLVTKADSPEAALLDMNGQIVHHWKMLSHRSWPRAEHVREPLPTEKVFWDRCYLYPNGDVLALCGAAKMRPSCYGIAKFDKDSNCLWGYSANVHHDFDVDEDGRIYALTQGFTSAPADLPGPDGISSNESLVILSPDGRELQSLSLYDAFRNSPYFLLLKASIEQQSSPGTAIPPGPPVVGGPPRPAPRPGPAAPNPGGQPTPPDLPAQANDFLHSNSVKVLPTALAPKFPQFKAGMVLISFRTSSLLAVVDIKARSVVWAAKGPWRHQHDVRFLDNGRLLLFDNAGAGLSAGSRVLEYDPVTQAVTWNSSTGNGDLFFSPFEGQSQRLPNGNTLICIPNGRILEMTDRHKVVWQWGTSLPPAPKGQPVPLDPLTNMASAVRYRPEDLTFLKENAIPQPR